MSNDREEVKDDEIEEVKDFKGKMMKRYLIEGFKKILNTKIDKYKNGYDLDDEEEFEEENDNQRI